MDKDYFEMADKKFRESEGTDFKLEDPEDEVGVLEKILYAIAFGFALWIISLLL